MAEARANRYISECPVCFEDFKSPRVLLCQHSFCLSCVEKIASKQTIKCPTCNKTQAVCDVKPDFRLEQFLEALNETKILMVADREDKKINPLTACELCKTKVFSQWCTQCEQWMCDSCQFSHSNTKISQDHEYVSAIEKANKCKEEIKGMFWSVQKKVSDVLSTPSLSQLQQCLLELTENKNDCLTTSN